MFENNDHAHHERDQQIRICYCRIVSFIPLEINYTEMFAIIFTSLSSKDLRAIPCKDQKIANGARHA